ncbi:NPCBM/NEW2 domain-containing protein [Paenibacillus gallinarum]|uniref:NPCBM/NEW2 domain-containing protein n=1 Tax=Paenibacillus gallinarum TaxID=2762232 RepID=A0ABR8T2F9_9BACL|nr:NPCBM/NEW2 domain-containing protein [Paenibacillus gallinarum]MBD7969936.1 NPCBM/NEW2 domain-containing protein [Paenibacillus gallinarum]
MKKMIVIATSAAMLLSVLSETSYVMANEVQASKLAKSVAQSEVGSITKAAVVPFDLYGQDVLHTYNSVYKMDNANITSITSNGGNYPGSQINKAIDGNMSTQWETGKPNSTTFTNEVVFQLNEITMLDRMVYAARQDSAKGKGFAQEFEIYGSTTDEGSNFTLVTTGEYIGSTGNVVEIKFAPTAFKRIKFVYKKVNQDWASAAEFSFYKEDAVSNKMEKLFTDFNQNQVSEEFNTEEKLKSLEESVKTHPLYELYKEDFENAKILLSEDKIEATKAATKPVDYYSNEEYSELFRMSNDNIKSFKNNGGNYASQVLKNAFDGNVNTYWETNRRNTADFANEVEVEFNEPVTLNRIVYGARPSDRKGFAQEFEIYGSKTSKGDTYELVATGIHSKVSGLVEAKFEPTAFKRLKFVFKNSDQNWATLSELAFYTEDEIGNVMEDDLFIDGTKSAVVPEYNSIDKINALEDKVKSHPLYFVYKEDLELAKKLVSGEVDMEGKIVKAEQRGDMRKHAQQNLRMNFGTNSQPTGLVATPGDTITVYVDAPSGSKVPSLTFTQQEGSWNRWSSSVSLKSGKNVITVPTISQDGYHHGVVKGGTIYIQNPYTPEEQGEAPVLRFEGVEKIPMMTLDTDPEQFKEELITYKKKIDEDVAAHPNVADRQVVNVVEMASDHVIFTGTATEAYNQFITKGNNPMDTVTGYDVWMNQIFKNYGLDGSSETNDPKRMRENIRLMQPYGAMYAAGDHTGIQNGSVAVMLSDFSEVAPGWGLNHEIGHRLAIGEREYGEVTNNMVSMLMSVEAHNMNNSNAIDNRIPFETIYNYVIEENKVTMDSQGLFARLGAYWQLELAYPGYWSELSKMYREQKVSLTNGDISKQQYYVEFSSELLGYDLSSYFARHGFTVTDETRVKTAKYPEPKKLWYLNNSVLQYEGTGIENKDASGSVQVSIAVNASAQKNTLNMRIDEKYQNDILGYEIYRDDILVGFTSTSQFIDSNVDASVNHTYQIIVYDKKLNPLNPIECNAFQPKLSVEDHVTLKLNQTFDPMDYVRAVNYQGKEITSEIVVRSSNVDVTKKGSYKVVYEVQSEGTTLTKTANVTVISNFDYASDLTAESARVGYGQFKKDTAPGGNMITLLRQGLEATYAKGIGAHANSEVVYDIEGKGYDFFESYIGVDYATDRTKASATFEVYVDGEKKFSSDVMKASSEHAFIKVPVTGAKKVTLVTTDAGDNNTHDHTVWADAKFTTASSAPELSIPKSVSTKVGQEMVISADYSAVDAEDGDITSEVIVTGEDKVNFNRAGEYPITYTVTDRDSNTATKTRTIAVVDMKDYTYLTDYEWSSTQNSYTAPLKDISISAKTLRLTDENSSEVSYTRGIGAHSNSTIVYDLTDKNFDYFTSFVGVDRQMYGSVGSVSFEVFVDGEKKFDSGLMNSKAPQKFVEVDMNGAKELKLVVTDGGNGNGSDHATWGDTKLHFANANRLFTDELEQVIQEAKASILEGYTSESIEVFTSSLARAEEVLANQEATQNEVEAAIAALKSAKEGLNQIDLTQVITVKDSYLSDTIKKTLGVNGELTLGDMYNLTSLTCVPGGRDRVRSLEGLEYAVNLETLTISGNEVTDFSPLGGLVKLNNFTLDPQYVEVAQLNGPVVEVDNLVTGIDGNKVIPYTAVIRNNKTFKETALDVSEWSQTPENFTFDLTNEEKGYYTFVVAYKVEGSLVQLMYIIDNSK